MHGRAPAPNGGKITADWVSWSTCLGKLNAAQVFWLFNQGYRNKNLYRVVNSPNKTVSFFVAATLHRAICLTLGIS